MNEFQEQRYPFTSLIDFIGGGYWFDPAALHLTLGLLFQLALIVVVFSRRRSLVEKATTCYFALTLYNNFAYNVGGLRISECFGVLSAVAVLLSLRRTPVARSAWVSLSLTLAGALILAHVCAVAATYPSVDPTLSTRALRLILVGKIFVLALVAYGIERHFVSRESLSELASAIVAAGVVACVLYLLQVGLYASGTHPYGTYWDAGFTGVPSFGSVSIERGHFGKFLVPLYPFFLLFAFERRRRWPLALFLFVSAINFSASSLAFLVGYVGLTLLAFPRRLLRGWGMLVLPLVATAITFVVVTFQEQYAGIVEKILDLAVRGGAGGGRSVDVLLAYLSHFPLGTSYGASTLRTVGGLPEINMGVFAFVSQLTVLAVPLFLGFVVLNVFVVHRSMRVVDPTVRRALAIGAIMSLVIYAADVLWFVPTIWAPLILLSRLSQPDRVSLPVEVPRQAEPPGSAALVCPS